MSRRRFFSSAQEPQVDPFNAGEPTMPWDDAEALHDEGCTFSDGSGSGYRPEVKAEDAYEAPKRPAASGGTEASTRSSAAKRHAMRQEAKRPNQSRRQAKAERRARAAAGASQADQPKRSHRGRTIIIVLLVIFLGPTVIGGIISCTAGIMASSAPGILGTSSYDDPVVEDTDEDKQQVKSEMQDWLDNMADDQDVRDLVVQGLNKRLKSNLGYTADELGIDANAYATWFLAKTSGTATDVYLWSDGTGSGYMDLTSPGVIDLVSEFVNDDGAYDYLRDRELYGSYDDGQQGEPLSDADKEKMRTLFNQTLDRWTKDEEDSSLSINVTRADDGSWAIDHDNFLDSLSFVFGVY